MDESPACTQAQTIERHQLEIEPRGPFRLDLTAWALRRHARNTVDRWGTASYERVISLDGGPVALSVTQLAGPDAPRLSAQLAGIRTLMNATAYPFLEGSTLGRAVLGASLLFILPTNWAKREATLTWSDAAKIDWGTIILFGTGIIFGSLLADTGLAETIGTGASENLNITNVVAITVFSAVLAVLISETTSNTASAAVIVPIVIPLCQAMGVDPFVPAMAATSLVDGRAARALYGELVDRTATTLITTRPLLLKRGDWFGELTILFNEPSISDVVAVRLSADQVDLQPGGGTAAVTALGQLSDGVDLGRQQGGHIALLARWRCSGPDSG